MEEACKSLKLVRFFIFSPLSFSSRRFFFVGRFCPTDFTDFADDADFSLWKGFVPQISQIYTDFLWNLW